MEVAKYVPLMVVFCSILLREQFKAWKKDGLSSETFS